MSTPPDPPRSPPPTQSDGSVLPFPDRFHEAVKYVTEISEDPSLNDEKRLMLYALHQQAERGKCTEPKPWSWNVVDSAKWNSWSQLGDMAAVEAMRLYVKFLETEIQPDWWIQSRGAELQSSQKQTAQQKHSIHNIQSLASMLTTGEWSEVVITGAKLPPPRYEHAIAVVKRKLYVIGGNCNGRYLNDVWTLDLDTLQWEQLQYTAAPREAVGGGVHSEPTTKQAAESQPPALPQIAGHALVVWGTSILCLGGHTKGWQNTGLGQSMVVRAFDTETRVWSVLNISGTAPPNRGSHTATLIGDSIYVFGGEEKSRRTADDLFVLDLTSMAWRIPEHATKGPSARSGHVATVFDDFYLLIFGGGSVARCYGDLWILDTKALSWTLAHVNSPSPAPRAGHAAALLGRDWIMVGGGDNKAGCTETLCLHIGQRDQSASEDSLPELSWTVVDRSSPTSNICSEGMGMVSIESEQVLLTFGGYNGRYQNTIHCRKAVNAQDKEALSSESKTASKAPETSTTRAASPSTDPASEEQAARKAARREQQARNNQAVLQNGLSGSLTGNQIDPLARVTSLEGVARDAQASRDAMQSEVGLMRKQLHASLEEKAKLEKDVAKLRLQLSNEQKKSMKLEVSLAEARQKLSTVSELERELENYRKLVEDAEQKGKSKSGLWTYIAGTDK